MYVLKMTFPYYTRDYLGNNRSVINGSTGAIEQTVAYYPYGAVIADLGTPTTGQPYKFGGKELITSNGLNEYDFGARQYYSAVPAFTRIDPMAEKYPWLSPYLYCANNPVNLVDPSGMDIWSLDEEGHVISSESFEGFDMLLVYDQDMKLKGNWTGDYGSITNQSSRKGVNGSEYAFFEAKDDKIGTSIFEFLADNTTVEWQQLKTGDGVENSINYVTSSHKKGEDGSAFNLITSRLCVEGTLVTKIREANHSHPRNTMLPSGIKSNDKDGDIFFARWLDCLAGYNVIYNIYTPGNRKYTNYNANSKEDDFISTYSEMW